MKAVMPSLLPDVHAFRQGTGADQWDEKWDGVVHLPPMPNFDHQDLEGDLASYLRIYWGRPRKAKALQQINLALPGEWPSNYRIPDILLLTPDRFHINRNEYFEGAPNVVVEIHSPGDEAHDKLPFYEELRVPEVWIIDRDTKEPEIYVLKRGRYRKQRPRAGGWLYSPATGIELQATSAGKLAIRLAQDDDTREELPVE